MNAPENEAMTQNDVVSTERLAEMLKWCAERKASKPWYGEGGDSPKMLTTVDFMTSVCAELLSRRSTDGEAVAWLSECISGPYQGQYEVERNKPDRPPFNQMWADWFPVYRLSATPTEPVAAPSGPVVLVKALEWHPADDGGLWAYSPLTGNYKVIQSGGEYIAVGLGPYPSEGVARGACDELHERRVRSALVSA